MTTKTIKTILFAALLVAMVLPFSGMDFANADKIVNKKMNYCKKSKHPFMIVPKAVVRVYA